MRYRRYYAICKGKSSFKTLKSIQVKQLSWKYIYNNEWLLSCWLLSCCYNPNLTLLNNHIQSTSIGLGFCSSQYDNFIVLGDFNAETSSTTIFEYCATYNLKNLIKEPTCFKSLENRTSIDLILTIRPKCFQNSCFWHWVIRFPEINFPCSESFQKQKPNIKYCIEAKKKFHNSLFRNDLLNGYYQKTFKPNILNC